MTVIWLIVWLITGTPVVTAFGGWNSWGVALVVCLAIDVLGILRGNTHRTRRAHR
jgi:hypothetical protein